MELAKIQPYIEKKLVSEQVHPLNSDIRIYNYTQRCQFEKAWDEVTTRCRGLILNVKTGEILANPFPKFFNYGEQPDLQIPSELPIITEKYDGSLGILYWIPGDARPWIATRGSFMSDQAQWATEWFRNNVHSANIPKKYTHLFEIIYPENRIVLSYDFSGLVLIGIRHIETGEDIVINDTIFKKFSNEVRVARQLVGPKIENLKQLEQDNKEGFVIFYPESGLRLKIKFDEYVRLHRLITGFSTKSIWECLANGDSLDSLLESVPDEFFSWVREKENELRANFARKWGRAQLAFQVVGGLRTRKDQALELQVKYKDVMPVVFKLIDMEDRQAVKLVWKMIKPKWELPFKKDIDA